MITLYHSSTQIVESPDIQYSRECLDFGKGFYLTTIREQAVKYAERFIRRGREAYINIYELDDDLSDYSKKEFDAYDEDWLDYVARCRKGISTEKYDWISGGIADDRVFNTLDLYFANEISKEEALRRLIYENPNYQICILNQELLSKHLHFKNAIKL